MSKRSRSADRPEGLGSNRQEVIARLRPWVKRAHDFTGWRFTDVSVHRLGLGPSWDYGRIVSERAVGRRSVLDMGTGDGEFLSTIRDTLPGRAVATEGWVVNAPVAYRRLSPKGVAVVRCPSARLPFRDSAFDLVINRHEELGPKEVDRVLARGGCFVTQQVGRHNWQELRKHFPRMTDFGDLRTRYVKAFRSRGYEVESQESDYKVAFGSLGDLVFMLCVTPWTIPDFDIERDLEALLRLEAASKSEEGLVLTECRFLVVAQKPP